MLNACSQKLDNRIPTNNKGVYSFQFDESKIDKMDSIFVKGRVLDVETEEVLEGSYINFYCEKAITNKRGEYNIALSSKLDVTYFFKAVSIGYKTIVTEMILLGESGELILDFYLEKDKTPIFHCDD